MEGWHEGQPPDMSCLKRNDLLQGLPVLSSGSPWSPKILKSFSSTTSNLTTLPNIDVEHVKSSRTWWCFRSRMTLPLWPQKLPIFEATLYSIHNWTMAIAKRSSNHYGICTHSSTNSLWTHFFGNSDIRGPKMHKYFIALLAYLARLSSFKVREDLL